MKISLRHAFMLFTPLITFIGSPWSTHAAEALPGLREVVEAGRDLWGEAAMRQPNGASFEFFEPLLPPPRYVQADFRYYPIVLSAPGAKGKARLISNGSGVNLRGGARSFDDVGTPVVFRVGPDEFRFGELRERVSLPQLSEGWLPIYEITYRHPFPVQSEGFVPINQTALKPEPEVYRLEAFVSTDPSLAEHAVVFVRFSLAAGSNGVVSALMDPPASAKWTPGRMLDDKGHAVALLDNAWKWERQGARAQLKPGKFATMAIPTTAGALDGFKFDQGTFGTHRATTVRTWKDILARAMHVEVPEARANNAWRHLLVQNFMLLNGDRINYSAGNQYERIYSAEGSDAALAMMVWGYEAETARMLLPLLDFTRKGLENHQAGLKLTDVIRYWWQTRDTEFVKATRSRWEKELERLVHSRTNANGLYPREQYCGDIKTPVHSLSVHAKAWRALHDLPPVLRAAGEDKAAQLSEQAAREFGPKLLDAVLKSARRETTPPFVPIALLDNESVHDPITETRIGSYWNIIIGYVIGSRMFAPGTPEDEWIPRYVEQHGGLCMGMVRSGGTAHGFWTGSDRVNPLYGIRYAVDTLRRDDPERALVSFYGMLAQGFTRNTFIAGEGSTLAPVDEGGRFFYCPPNSAGNAHLLTMLRNMLVQDFDLDGDGEPETVRLCFATSRRWLEDGKSISVERAPTVFGPVSVKMESKLSQGAVLATVALPSRNTPKQTLLRARLPEPWRVTSAEAAGRKLAPDDRGTVDLSVLRGTVMIRFNVAQP
jgi:hypothetical protein